MSFGAFFQSCTFSSWVIFFTLLAFLSSFFHCYLTLLAFLSSSFFSLFPAVLNVFCSFLMVISFQVFLVGDFQSFTFLIFIFIYQRSLLSSTFRSLSFAIVRFIKDLKMIFVIFHFSIPFICYCQIYQRSKNKVLFLL
ncbi:hypothetical protein I3842_16G002900 [Carya illinoinensis]|uniref:Uncharacterized protein n=1 Tax=Carya illinoinensis TaxID=32201 RepID=A0A922D3U0_CARIL|nr:hypothetical protein I3842_16G002900 [Carya illinoinensis]